MPDVIARNRLKEKMLDRWENEGGRIASETTSGDENGPTSENKRPGKKQSALGDNPTRGVVVSAIKTRKRSRK